MNAKFEKLLKNPWRIDKSFARRGLLSALPDKWYLACMYRANFGKKLDWKNPKTYNEKLQWLKLYDRNPEYPGMVDKYEAKRFISDHVGEEFVPKVLGGPWNSFEEIDFAALPDQFVLKTTHDCGGVLICKDKAKLDMAAAKAFLDKHLHNNYYWGCREWLYKEIVPRIFAEEYLEDAAAGELMDYKFFCFDGVPKIMFIASERQRKDTEVKFDFFDMDFHHLSIIQGHPNSEKTIPKPVNFEKMQELAQCLSRGIPHIRVDFYENNGKLYVGELTFSHFGGNVPFNPPEWDETLGEWLVLPQKRKQK